MAQDIMTQAHRRHAQPDAVRAEPKASAFLPPSVLYEGRQIRVGAAEGCDGLAIRFSGVLDEESREAMRLCTRRCQESDQAAVVLDVADVSSISAHLLGVLLVLCGEVRQRQKAISFLVGDSDAGQFLRRMGVDHIVPLH